MTSSDDLREALALVDKPRFQYAISPAEDAMARAYAIHHDPVKAWTDANMPELATKASQSQAAGRLIQTGRVQERLAYYHQLQAARLDIRDDRLMAETAAIAFSDPLDFFDESNKLLPLTEMPRHARAAIKSIEVNETEDLLEDGSTRIKRRNRILLWDKLKALDLAARVKGMYHDPARTDPPRVIFEVGGAPVPRTQAPHTPVADLDEPDLDAPLEDFL